MSFPIFDKCYHGSISAQQAEDRLRSACKESSYLTRESDLKRGQFILSTISKGNIVNHFFVPDCDGKNKKQSSFTEAKSDIERLVLSRDDCCHPVPPPWSISNGGTVRTGPRSPSCRQSETEDNGLKCQVCEKSLETRYDLAEHYCGHFMEDLEAQFPQSVADLQCELCSTGSKVFTQKRNLLHHLGCKHGKINDVIKQKGLAELPDPELACYVCGEVQNDEKSMYQHLKTHRLQQCHHCKQFLSSRKYEKHIKFCEKNLDKLLHQCQHCEYSTPLKYDLVKHVESNHQKPFSCTTCSKGFNNEESLGRHQKLHEALQYCCPHCDKSFKELKYLNSHIKKRHLNTKIKSTVGWFSVDPGAGDGNSGRKKGRTLHHCRVEGCQWKSKDKKLLKKHHDKSHPSDPPPPKVAKKGCDKEGPVTLMMKVANQHNISDGLQYYEESGEGLLFEKDLRRRLRESRDSLLGWYDAHQLNVVTNRKGDKLTTATVLLKNLHHFITTLVQEKGIRRPKVVIGGDGGNSKLIFTLQVFDEEDLEARDYCGYSLGGVRRSILIAGVDHCKEYRDNLDMILDKLKIWKVEHPLQVIGDGKLKPMLAGVYKTEFEY